MLPNETLARVVDNNLRAVGGYTYTEPEKIFAEKIQQTFQAPVPSLSMTNSIGAFQTYAGSASTDVGDVSWVVPTVQLSTATWVLGTPAHSWQAVAAGGTSIGTKGMMVAAKTMALTAVELLADPQHVAAAKTEFARRLNGYAYQNRIGDRKPPLDYRR